MQENEELRAELKSAVFRDALMATISLSGRIGREQLLDMVFRAYDKAIAELVRSGKIVVEKSPQDESHLDTFIAAEPKSG